MKKSQKTKHLSQTSVKKGTKKNYHTVETFIEAAKTNAVDTKKIKPKRLILNSNKGELKALEKL